jgi:hypothetical protein
VRGGFEFDAQVKVIDDRPAAVIIAERLQRLSAGALQTATELISDGVTESGANPDIIDVEVVELPERTNEDD